MSAHRQFAWLLIASKFFRTLDTKLNDTSKLRVKLTRLGPTSFQAALTMTRMTPKDNDAMGFHVHRFCISAVMYFIRTLNGVDPEPFLTGMSEKSMLQSFNAANSLNFQELLARSRREPAAQPAALPQISMSDSLMPHQQENIAWMLEQEETPTQFQEQSTSSSKYDIIYNPYTSQVTFRTRGAAHHLTMPNPVRRGGLLADEVGLGKTVTLLALTESNPPTAADMEPRAVDPFFQWHWSQPHPRPKMPTFQDCLIADAEIVERIENSPAYLNRHQLQPLKATLIVAPVAICGQWMSEIQRWLPTKKMLLFHGVTRSNFTMDDFQSADFILTTYETLDRTRRELNGMAAVISAASPFVKYDRRLATILRITGTLLTPPPAFTLNRLHFHRIVYDEAQKVSAGTRYYRTMLQIKYH